MKKVIFILGIAIGVVIGSRLGRGPYESLERGARRVAEDPHVRESAERARETVVRAAHDTAETAKKKAPEAAAAVREKVSEKVGEVSGRRAAGASDPEDAPDAGTSPEPDDSAAAIGLESADLGSDDAGPDAGATPDRGAATGTDAEGVVGGDAEVGDDRPLSS